MQTLHIEHAITASRLFEPVDDDRYIVIQLDFDSVDAAEHFRGFLEANVWSTPANSPGLAGSPTARVLTNLE